MLKLFKTTKDIKSLRRFNVIAGLLHLVQGTVMLFLLDDKSEQITTNYLTFDPSSQSLVSATTNLFPLSLGWLTVSFLFMSAIAHFVIATVYRDTYERDLKKGINKARWIEYSVSASTMMVAIALLSGIYDLGSLIMVFALVAGMNLMGLVMELWNQTTKKPNWTSYIIGCGAGIVPWLVFLLYVITAEVNATTADGGVPTFVYFIYVSIFLFFNSFAVNMYLQYKKIGKWANYLYGERVYIILSLVAKSLLAWQVFAGTLQP